MNSCPNFMNSWRFNEAPVLEGLQNPPKPSKTQSLRLWHHNWDSQTSAPHSSRRQMPSTSLFSAATCRAVLAEIARLSRRLRGRIRLPVIRKNGLGRILHLNQQMLPTNVMIKKYHNSDNKFRSRELEILTSLTITILNSPWTFAKGPTVETAVSSQSCHSHPLSWS